MQNFFKYPHTPHLAWLGGDKPRDDKVVLQDEVRTLLTNPVLLEEKLDGANVGISLDCHGNIRVQNRGSVLLEPFQGQFSRLSSWLTSARAGLEKVLTNDLILFGEWCAATHSIRYSTLPDWFLLFDVYSLVRKEFWSTARRNDLASVAGLRCVPSLGHGVFSLDDLAIMTARQISCYSDGPIEGLIVRSENGCICTFKAKLVRADFTQSIVAHWSSKRLQWNSVSSS